MVKLGLKKEFLGHRERTIEAFAQVSNDISSLSAYVQTIQLSISNIENRLSNLETETSEIRNELAKANSTINIQKQTIQHCSQR